MPLEVAVAGILFVALVFYGVSGGADYGGGMWDLLASGPRARRQREAIEHAIAPIWEANHVWLILVVTVVFTGFPRAFAPLMIALHVPLTLVLLGIVFRGAAFVFRKYDRQDDVVHRRWSTVFGVASFLTPFLLGLVVGGLASGDIRVTADGRVASGFFAGWTGWFAISCGLFAQGLFAFLAAVYLTADTADDVELREDFRRRALMSGVLLAPSGILVAALALHGAPLLFERLLRPWAPWLVALAIAATIGAVLALQRRRFAWARAAAVCAVAVVLTGWGLAQFPHVIVPDVTIYTAPASPRTLTLLLVALGVGALLLFPSFAYLYWVFKAAPGRASATAPDL